MTPAEVNIAIAEHIGWTQIEDRSHSLMMPKGFSVVGYPPTNPIVGKKEAVPDYCNDLNAIHQAEMMLEPKTFSELGGRDKLKEYRERLEMICLGNFAGTLRATASQRCEAFLKTLGLWKV